MTAEDEVRALSAAWDTALVHNDAPLVASFMTDDWVYVGPTGATSKSDVIGWIASGRSLTINYLPYGSISIIAGAEERT